MANPLKFEIHIGSQLAQDIQKYTTALNSLIKMFDKKNITIGVDSRLTEIVTQLTNGFKDINTQQAEGLKNLKAITEYLSQQQKAMAGSTTLSQQSAEAANKEADAYKKVTAEKEKAAAAGGQQKTLFDTTAAEKVKNELGQYQQAIQKVVTDIQESINGMAKGIDIEAATKKFRDSVQSLLTTLEPFQKMLSAFSTFGGDFPKVTTALTTANTELLNSLKQVSEAQKNNAAATNNDSDAKQKAGEGIRTYFDNVVKLERALVRLEAAEQKAGEAREKIVANNGNTSDVDRYLANIRAVIDAINKVRNMSPDVLGQKGSMISMDKNLQDSILGILKADPSSRVEALNTLAQMLGKSKVELKDIIDLLSDAGPLGQKIVRALGADTGFMKYANELEKAVPKVKNAEQEMADAQARLNSVISRSGNADTSKLQKLQAELQGVKSQFDKLKDSGDTVGAANLLDATYTKLIQNIKTASNEQEKLLSNTDKLNFILKDVMSMNEGNDWTRRFSAMLERYKTVSADFIGQNGFFSKSGLLGGDDSIVNRLAELREKIKAALASPDQLNQQNKVTELVMEYNKLSYAYHSCWSQLEKLVSAQERSNKKSGGKSEEQIQAEEANRWYGNLIHTLMKYQELVQKGNKLNLDTSDLEKAIEELDKFRAKAKEIADNKGKTASGETARNTQFSPAYVDASAKASMQASTLSLQIKQAKAAASATSKLADEQQRLAQAFNSATKEAHGQSQVVSDLKSLMAQYFSVYGAQQFLSEMVNITGELELQRKSLEVILDSGTAASEMYSQIRDLSQQSPYSFEDLLKAHRQLAAFGIDAKDIYGTMKSLTDIGAGLDVPVDRLILAYGHTKSYGYLSGIQNRQFETAGIDLVGALTKHYNDLADAEEKAGRAAEHVTRKDIFKRMRTRDIPFEDVQQVIMDMDQPGGKFYNMQLRQYDTLGGKLRNLRNNYRIMMSEIGQSSYGLLTTGVNAINTITEKWSKFVQVIEDVLVPLGAARLAMLAFNKAGSAAVNNITSKTLDALRQTEMARASRPTNFWQGLKNGWGANIKGLDVSNATENTFRGELTNGLSNGNITKNMAIQMAYAKNLPPQLRKIAAELAGMSAAEAEAASKTTGLSRSMRLLGLRVTSVGSMIGRFARSIWSTIWNPQTIVFGAIMGITSIVNWYRDESERVNRISNDLRDNASRDLETISSTLDELQGKYGVRLGQSGNTATTSTQNREFVHTSDTATKNGKAPDDTLEGMPTYWRNGAYNTLDETQMMADGIENIIEDLDKKLQVLDPLYQGDLFDVKKFNSQYSQANDMIAKLSDIEYAKKIEETTSGLMASANKDTHNIFTDSYATDIKDYQDAVQEANNALMKLNSTDITNFFDDKKNNKTYNQSVRDFIANFEKDNADLNKAGMEREKLKKMFEQGGLTKVGMTPGRSKVNTYIEALGDVESAKKEISKSVPEIAETVEHAYTDYFKGRPQAFSYYLRDSFNSLMSDFKVSDPSVIEDQYLQLYKQIADDLASKGDISGLKEFQRQFANAIMGSEVEDQITKNLDGKKLSDLTKPELNKLVDSSVKTVRDRLIAKFPMLRSVILRLFGSGSDELNAALNDIRKKTADFAEAWKKEAQSKLGNTLFGPSIDSAESFIEWIDAAGKKAKEFQDGINKLRPVLKVKFGMDFSTSKQMLDYFKRFKDPSGRVVDLSKSLNTLPQKIKTPQGGVIDTSIVMQMYDFLVAMEQIEKVNKDMGTTIGHDTKKENSAAEKARKEREKAENDADRRLIRNLQNRQKAITTAFSKYWEWYEKLGKDNKATIARVQKYLKDSGMVFPAEYDINSIADIDSINKILDKEKSHVKNSAKRLNNKKDNEGSINSILSSLQSSIDQNEQKKFDDNTKKYTSELDLQLKTLEKQYDLYKKIYDLTGNRRMALQLSGRQKDVYDSYQSKADDMRDAIQSNIANALSNMNLKGITNRNIDFGKVFGLDDEGITKYVGELFNETENGKLIENNQALQEMIAGVVDKLKEWRDAQKAVNDESITNTAEILGNLKDYSSLLDKIKAKYGNLNADIMRQGIHSNEGGVTSDIINGIGETIIKSGYLIPQTPREKADRANRADYAYDTFKLTPEYRALIEKSIAMPMNEIKNTAVKAIRLLTEKLLAGTLSPEDYQKERDNIINAVSTIYQNRSTGGIFSFLNGGMSQVYRDRSALEGNEAFNYYLEADRQKKNANDAQDKIDKYSKDLNEAIKNGDMNGVSRATQNLIGANFEKSNAITAFKEAFGKGKDKEKESDDDKEKADKQDRLNKQIDAVIKGMQALQSAFSLLSNTFDSLGLGDTGIGSVMSDASDLMGSVLGGASSLSAFGPWGMAAGAGLGLLGGLAGLHDKHAQQKIDKLQDDVSKIEGYTEVISKAQERTLGYDRGDIIREYQRQYAANQATIQVLGRTISYNKEGDAGSAMIKYYNAAGTSDDISGYQQQYNLLIQKRKDYIGMYDAENSKKKKSKQALEEYKEKIAELDDQIRFFSEDLAKTLYDIDLKSWADQLSDALMTAFENGEDAAEAFDNSVTSILQGIVKKMVAMGVIEPLFEKLRVQLFGDGKGQKGSFDINNPTSNQDVWMGQINDALGDDGYVRKGIESAQILFDSMETLANKYGNTLMNSNSASMSSSIKGITEQTADLLAAYLNAIRADVSVIRQIYGVKAVPFMESMSEMAKSQVQYQSQIATNTLRNAEAAEAIRASTSDILYILNAVVNDAKRFNVNAR